MIHLCRICLGNEANIPIFGSQAGDKKEKVISILKSCTNIEIADVPGYPRSICGQCHVLVEAAYELINKFVESNKILNSKIYSVKEEKLNESEAFPTGFEIEISPNFKEESQSSKSDEETLQDIKNNKSLSGLEHFDTNDVSMDSRIPKIKKETVKKKKVLNKKLGKVSKNKISKNIKSKSLNKVEKKQKEIEEKKKPPEKSNLCEHCGLALKTKESLAIHILKYHSEKLYCPECPYTNHSKKNLNMHIKRNHSEKKEKCSQCGNGFAILNDLKHHILKVHGKKKEKKMYDCQYCDAKLARPYLKVMHERTVHAAFYSHR